MINTMESNVSGQELLGIYNTQAHSDTSDVYTEHHDSHTDIPDYDDTSW